MSKTCNRNSRGKNRKNEEEILFRDNGGDSPVTV